MLKNQLNAIVFDDEITVFWYRACTLENTQSYEVYLNGEKVGEVKKTHFEFFSLTPDTEYCIRVVLNGFFDYEQSFVTKKAPISIDVTKAPYNAVGDGKTLNTKALQRAIDDCGCNARVYIPEGVYLTGALKLHSDMELYIEKGATVQGSTLPEDYMPFIKSRSEGLNMECYQSLINMGDIDEAIVYNCENVSIRGGGRIVGGGLELMRAFKEQGLVILKDYIDSLGERINEFDRKEETVSGRLRGRLINMSNCRNIVLSGVYLADGPYWNNHIIYSDNVVTNRCTIYTRGIHNGDGWNPDSSTNCTCFDCDFDCGDNCVAIKSGRNPDGNRIARPTRNVSIFDCRVNGGGGFAIGSELSGGVEEVDVWDNDCSRGSLGFSIKTTRKRGGYVRGVRVFDNLLPNFRINASYTCNNDGQGADSLTTVEDVICENNVLLGTGTEIEYGDEARNTVKEIDIHSVIVVGFDGDEGNFDNIIIRNNILKKKATKANHTFQLDHLNGLTIENLR